MLEFVLDGGPAHIEADPVQVSFEETEGLLQNRCEWARLGYLEVPAAGRPAHVNPELKAQLRALDDIE